MKCHDRLSLYLPYTTKDTSDDVRGTFSKEYAVKEHQHMHQYLRVGGQSVKKTGDQTNFAEPREQCAV